jgi:hypothetical protein
MQEIGPLWFILIFLGSMGLVFLYLHWNTNRKNRKKDKK